MGAGACKTGTSAEIRLLLVLWVAKSFVYDPVLCVLPASMKLWQAGLDYKDGKISDSSQFLTVLVTKGDVERDVNEEGWEPHRPPDFEEVPGN